MTSNTIPPELREAARVSKAWPYEEARKLLNRYRDGPGEKAIVFETGYGPSGQAIQMPPWVACSAG